MTETPAITGRLGAILAGAVLAFPMVSGIVQFTVDAHREDLNRQLEEKKLDLNQELEKTKNDLAARTEQETNHREVSKLFLDHYKGATGAEQRRTIDIMVTLYPQEFVGVAKLFRADAGTPKLKAAVQKAASAAATTAKIYGSMAVGQSATTADAGTLESQGFAALIDGNLATASTRFLSAYKIFPNYHNVDEIAHLVLTPHLLSEYARSDSTKRVVLLRQTLTTVVHSYSWGVSPSQLNQMQAKVRG